MKRFGIFAVVGPLIGLTLLLVAAAATGMWRLQADMVPNRMALDLTAVIFLSYLFGLVPLLLVVVID